MRGIISSQSARRKELYDKLNDNYDRALQKLKTAAGFGLGGSVFVTPPAIIATEDNKAMEQRKFSDNMYDAV